MKQILFIGNSLTFFNDLPETLRMMAEKAGVEIAVDSVLKGGAYLRQFADEACELGQKLRAKYGEHPWDAVILQDQSFNPAKNPAGHLEAVKKIITDVVTNGEEIYLYQTWAYQDGTEKLGMTGMTYDAMGTALRESYAASAEAVGGICVPVGDAFALAAEKGVDLYNPDNYHPSTAGTYLAACLFFRYLLGRIPSAEAVPGGMDGETAAILRECAEKTR